jgi:outer membrane protein assembly factor BamA
VAEGLLWQPIADASPLLRLSATLDAKRPVSANMQVVAGLAAGYLGQNTPLTLQYKLGGSRMLRGYNPTLLTTGYAHSSLELRRYVKPDTHAALFVDAALLDIGDHKRAAYWSPGVAARYLTPVGQTVQAMAAWAPNTNAWRFGTGFTTIW